MKNKRPLALSKIYEVVTRELYFDDTPATQRLVETFVDKLFGQFDMQEMGCQTENIGVIMNVDEVQQTQRMMDDLDLQMRDISDKFATVCELNESMHKQNELILSQTKAGAEYNAFVNKNVIDLMSKAD